MIKALQNELKQIKTILARIGEVNSINDLETILQFEFLKSTAKDKVKYPPLPFAIQKNEIEALKKDGWLNAENQLNVEKFEGANTLEKLLFSLIWKNGDLRKISKILDGIESKPFGDSDRITFYKFGEFLKNPKTEIIVDQHVIRAFRYIKAIEEGLPLEELAQRKKLDYLTGKHDEDIGKYKAWIKENKWVNPEIKTKEKYLEIMDDIMFAIGKKIKGK